MICISCYRDIPRELWIKDDDFLGFGLFICPVCDYMNVVPIRVNQVKRKSNVSKNKNTQ